MRTFLAFLVVVSTTMIAKADTDYEWQAKAAAAAINLRYEQPKLLTETNKAPWILSAGVNTQQPQMVAPEPQPTVRVQQAQQNRVVTVTRPFVQPDSVLGPLLGARADPNDCPPEG